MYKVERKGNVFILTEVIYVEEEYGVVFRRNATTVEVRNADFKSTDYTFYAAGVKLITLDFSQLLTSAEIPFENTNEFEAWCEANTGSPVFKSATGGSVAIPSLKMTVGRIDIFNEVYPSLYTQIMPALDETWKTLNPRIFLFKYKKRVASGNLEKEQLSGYKHPPHQNGINFPKSSVFGGARFNHLKELLPGQDTEFNISDFTMNKRIEFGFNPLHFTRHKNLLQQLVPGDFPFPKSMLNPLDFSFSGVPNYVGSRGVYKATRIHFKFAIGIDNPNNQTGE